MADNKFSLVWTAAQLLYALIFKLRKQGVLEDDENVSCPVNIDMSYPNTVFASLHPCKRYPPPSRPTLAPPPSPPHAPRTSVAC